MGSVSNDQGDQITGAPDLVEQLLQALKEATGEDSDSLETQFFRYYQKHNHELTHFPVFETGTLPEWDELTLFVLLNNDDRWIVDDTQALSAEAFSETVTRFFGSLEYQDKSSEYLTFKDGIYLAVPGDTMRNGFFRLKEISAIGGKYTATFDAFYFTDVDFTAEYDEATVNQRTVRDQAGTKDALQAQPFADALLEILSQDAYATRLDVSETVTVTFSLSGDPKSPFTYSSCRVQGAIS